MDVSRWNTRFQLVGEACSHLLSLAGGTYWRHPCPTSAESLCEALRIQELKTAARKDDPKKSVTNLPETNSSIPKIWTIFSPNIPPKKRMDDGGEHLSPNFYRFLDGSFRRLPRVPGSLVLVRLKAAMKYRLNTWWLWRRQILGKHMAWVKKISQEKRKNRKKTVERTETPIEKPGLSLSKKIIFGTFVVFLMQI